MADVNEQGDPERYAYLAEGNARQARKRVSAKVVVRDEAGRVLLVDPVYKAHWDLPGGMAEANESPRSAAARELREELGLALPIGRLLLLDWVGPREPWDDLLVFTFDGGVLDTAGVTGLAVRDPEIAAYRFADVGSTAGLLRADVHRRLAAALDALRHDTSAYDEGLT